MLKGYLCWPKLYQPWHFFTSTMLMGYLCWPKFYPPRQFFNCTKQSGYLFCLDTDCYFWLGSPCILYQSVPFSSHPQLLSPFQNHMEDPTAKSWKLFWTVLMIVLIMDSIAPQKLLWEFLRLKLLGQIFDPHRRMVIFKLWYFFLQLSVILEKLLTPLAFNKDFFPFLRKKWIFIIDYYIFTNATKQFYN